MVDGVVVDEQRLLAPSGHDVFELDDGVVGTARPIRHGYHPIRQGVDKEAAGWDGAEMFERFTQRARRVLVLAQEEAAGLRHDFIGTEHILIGMLAEREGIAGQVLTDLGLELEGLRDQVRKLIGPTVDQPVKKAPFTARAKKCLELALREALALKHNYIGTEHLLLGILHEGEGVAAQILAERGGKLDEVRRLVIAKLEGFGGAAEATAPATGQVAPARPRHTPAVEAIVPRAEEFAGDHPVGSHHLLRAIVDEADSLAARVLTSFGITKEALDERLAAMGTEGTTDDVPAFSVHVFAGGLTIRVDDEDLAEKVRRGELTVTFRPTA